MATEPRFTKRNVIKDKGMLDAFKDGVVEGMTLALESSVYEIKIEFEGTQLNTLVLQDIEAVVEAVRHALATPGVKVTVEVGTESSGSEPMGQISPSMDDEVVEAELLD